MRVGQMALQLTMQQTQRQNQLKQAKSVESVEPVEPQSISEQLKSAKQVVKETAQRMIDEIQEARNDLGEDDPKVQQLMEKFNSGRKLTAEEMSYIQKKAPGQLEYIQRIMREREIMELSMRLAPSKMDVQITAIRIAKNIEKHPDAQEREVLANHLRDAKRTYEETDEYKEKPNSLLDSREKRATLKINIKPKKEAIERAYDYTAMRKKDEALRNELIKGGANEEGIQL